jgi:hypothetical protein
MKGDRLARERFRAYKLSGFSRMLYRDIPGLCNVEDVYRHAESLCLDLSAIHWQKRTSCDNCPLVVSAAT